MAEIQASKLFAAVGAKNEELALTYLEHSTHFEQLNVLDDQGRSILVRGIQEGLKEFVRKLLNHNEFTALNAKDNNGRTAIHWASIRNQFETVQVLLNTEAFKEASGYDKKPWTAMHHAAARGFTDLVRLLSNHKRFTEVQGTYGRDSMSALHLAARRGHPEVCKVLLENPLVQKSNLLTRKCWTALHCAAFSGHADVIEALLECTYFGERTIDSRDNNDGWNALHVAAVHGNAKACLALMNGERFNAYRDRDWHNRSAIHLAALRGHAAVILVLLNHPRYPASEINGLDKDTRTALHTCVSLQHYQASLVMLTHPRFTASYQIDNSGLTAHDMAEGELLRVWNELLIFESLGNEGKENYNGWLQNGGSEREIYHDKQSAAWRKNQVAEIFDMLDDDRSGEIGWEELMRLGEVRRRNYHKVFADMRGDWNKDLCLKLLAKMEPKGGNGKIDRFEFAQFFVARLPHRQDQFEKTIAQFKDALSAEEQGSEDEKTILADGLTP